MPRAIHGDGLFSTRERAAGEHVVMLDGQAVPLDAVPEALFTLEWNALSEHVLLVRPLRTSYGYINHAHEPNLVIAADGVTISTARVIAAGEEFTLDYAAQQLPPRYLDSPRADYLRARSALTPGRHSGHARGSGIGIGVLPGAPFTQPAPLVQPF